MFNGAILNPQCKRERVLCIFILLKTLKRHQFASPSIISYFRNLKAFFQVKNSTLLKFSPESNQADFQQSLPVLDSALLMTNLAKTHNNLSVIRLKVYCQITSEDRRILSLLSKYWHVHAHMCTHTTGFVAFEWKAVEQIPKIPLKSMLDFFQTFGKTCKTMRANLRRQLVGGGKGLQERW